MPQPTTEIFYPCSDGQPMGETDVHIAWIIRLRDIMKYRHRTQRVYVGADMFIYWVEGENGNPVCPDVFVVKDCPPDPPRRRFLTWEEGQVPHVVFEIVSLSSTRRDRQDKVGIYADMGVAEYYLYDPEGFTSTPLQGHRLVEGEYITIEPDAAGRMKCNELGFTLEVNESDLVLRDLKTGDLLLTEAEAEAVARKAAEAEVARLRKLLDEQSRSEDGGE